MRLWLPGEVTTPFSETKLLTKIAQYVRILLVNDRSDLLGRSRYKGDGMNQGLTTGAKFGYFVLGLFLSLIGVLIAWLINKDKDRPTKSGALKFSIIGCVISFAGIVLFYIGTILVFLPSIMRAY